jgi:hypothetical protein
VATFAMPNSTATTSTGESSGSSTSRSRRQKPAPSTTEASSISCGSVVIPASTISVANGNMRHAWTSTIATRASVGSPSQ